jgi:hypothetical protein
VSRLAFHCKSYNGRSQPGVAGGSARGCIISRLPKLRSTRGRPLGAAQCTHGFDGRGSPSGRLGSAPRHRQGRAAICRPLGAVPSTAHCDIGLASDKRASPPFLKGRNQGGPRRLTLRKPLVNLPVPSKGLAWKPRFSGWRGFSLALSAREPTPPPNEFINGTLIGTWTKEVTLVVRKRFGGCGQLTRSRSSGSGRA